MGLAILDGHDGFLGAQIAGDQLDLRLQHLVQDDRIGVRIGPRAGPRDDHLLLAQILHGLERRRSPGQAHAHILADRAHPGEFAHVIAGVAGADQRLDHRPACKRADGRAIARGGFGQKLRGANAPRARHVLHHHIRGARQIFAHMPRQRPGQKVDAPASRARNINGDGLVEIFRLRARGACEAGRGDQACGSEPRHRAEHGVSPSKFPGDSGAHWSAKIVTQAALWRQWLRFRAAWRGWWAPPRQDRPARDGGDSGPSCRPSRRPRSLSRNRGDRG